MGPAVSVWEDSETAAYLLALKRQGLTCAQVYESYCCDRPDWFPWTADDPEYDQKREEAIDAIKRVVCRLKAKLKTAVERVDTGAPMQ